tara:strand:+ start:453 stop:1085 length:633 start_codon:yes stop_codon:yes gene_type:complete
MEQLINIVLPAVISCVFSGLIIKISLSFSKQSWSDNFQYTLICLLLPIITFFVTKVISNNIALSLGMVGALSIVRFRNPVKNSLELVIYFSLIAVGIAAGVNVKYAFLLGATISFIILLLYYLSLILKQKKIDFFSFSHNSDNDLCSIEIESNEEIKIDLFKKYLQHFHFNRKEKIYFYRFSSKDQNIIDEISRNFKSLDHIKSIDVKYV